MADKRRKTRMKAELEKKARLHLKKGSTFNNVLPDPYPKPHLNPNSYPNHQPNPNHNPIPFQNMEEQLAESVQAMEDELKIMGHAKMTFYSYLKRQFAAREARAGIDKYTYPETDGVYRDKTGKKLKMTPSNGEDKHEHIKNWSS